MAVTFNELLVVNHAPGTHTHGTESITVTSGADILLLCSATHAPRNVTDSDLDSSSLTRGVWVNNTSGSFLDREAEIWHLLSPSAGAGTLTINFSDTQNSHGFWIGDVTGDVDTAGIGGTGSAKDDTGSGTSTTAFTPGANNRAAIGISNCGPNGGTQTDASTPTFTIIENRNDGISNANDFCISYVEDTGADGSKTYANTLNASDEWGIAAMAIRTTAVNTRRYSLPLVGVG